MLTFSLVIPNFNQSHYLPTALESLRHQGSSFNVALMDGGSTDAVREVAKLYQDLIAFFRSAPDAGQAAAIREGFEQVPGEVLCWLNADDYYFPGALDRVAACFEADPELDVVYGDAVHVTEEGFFLSYFPPVREYEAGVITRSCFICQPACFFRRSACEKVGGVDASLVYTMDWDLWCRLDHAGAKFRYLHEPLAAVRYYRGTKTLSGNRRRYLEIWRIEKQYGRRSLPLSWPGFYLYDLTFKSDKTVGEILAFNLLNALRHFKHALVRLSTRASHPDRTLYGFHRWEPVVEGRCTIHLPWYDQRPWKKIILTVEPPDRTFEVGIDDLPSETVRATGGRLVLDVPPLEGPDRRITIADDAGRQWKLLDFACEFK